MRVSIDGIGSLTQERVVSANRALTHLQDLSSQQITELMQKARQFLSVPIEVNAFVPSEGKSGTIIFNDVNLNQANYLLMKADPKANFMFTGASVLGHEMGMRTHFLETAHPPVGSTIHQDVSCALRIRFVGTYRRRSAVVSVHVTASHRGNRDDTRRPTLADMLHGCHRDRGSGELQAGV